MQNVKVCDVNDCYVWLGIILTLAQCAALTPSIGLLVTRKRVESTFVNSAVAQNIMCFDG